ncbi:hypothetical protein GX51_05211 [Blastomyces parvus]|uniref:Uncharacterized protein n=1 Tax=Blastomyces parvus TaxID=2060905 RepID=A0A2B7WQ79_9EURO|nr:hypothetical protein GX51_05211 [Blastomyces parvus]
MATSPPPALTTPFSAPAACLNNVYEIYSTEVLTESGSLKTEVNVYHELGLRTKDCYPSGGYLPWSVDQISQNAYYSPGVCPSGYLICSSDTNAVGTLTETRATCCPNGFACQKVDAFFYSDHMCSRASNKGVLTFTATSNGKTEVHTKDGNWAVNAYGLSIRWMSSDFAAPTSTTSTTSTTFTEPPALGPPLSPPSSTSSGLSTGAKAGIGIGAAVAVLLLVVIGWLLHNALQNRKHKQGGKIPSSDYQAVPQKADPTIAPPHYRMTELDSYIVHEMDTSK